MFFLGGIPRPGRFAGDLTWLDVLDDGGSSSSSDPHEEACDGMLDLPWGLPTDVNEAYVEGLADEQLAGGVARVDSPFRLSPSVPISVMILAW